MFLVVRLWLCAGCDIGEFEKFEREANAIIKSHGGRIERAFRAAQAQSEVEPFEVHLVWFPGEAAFAAYREDERTLALRARRDLLIARTDVWRGEEEMYGI